MVGVMPEVDTALAGDLGCPKQVQVLERGQAGQVLQPAIADAWVVSVQSGQA